MARITIEDCLDYIPNRFDLTLSAAYRAKELIKGKPCALEIESSSKHVVVALLEISHEKIDTQVLNKII
jgi:DNA-directed RNA polymerase subunit omega